MSCEVPKPDANDAADAKDANSAFESEDQPWSVTITPDNEKPITFRIYQGEPIEFDLTYKDKDELWKALQQKLSEINAPPGKLYYIVYPFDYSLIESADDLIAAILPDRPLKLFTTAAEADDTSTSSSSSEDDSSIRGHHSHRRRRHRCDSSGTYHWQHPHHHHGYHSGFPRVSHFSGFSGDPYFGCKHDWHHAYPPSGYMGCWGCCRH